MQEIKSVITTESGNQFFVDSVVETVAQPRRKPWALPRATVGKTLLIGGVVFVCYHMIKGAIRGAKKSSGATDESTEPTETKNCPNPIT